MAWGLRPYFFDAATSYGTRIWNPFSSERVAWDFVFIIDFVFTAIVLLPQVAAWAFSDREKGAVRGGAMWLLFNVSAAGVWWIARWFGFPFHAWILRCCGGAGWDFSFAAGRGSRVSDFAGALVPGGLVSLVVYVALCAWAHHLAMERVRDYALRNHLDVILLGAIPSPPSFLEWSGTNSHGGGDLSVAD